uniref:Secreted protein n=1 Tax=Ascaris lumbricoides TaxID=6252 RepID=A0A0M3I531_ASCLU
MASSCMKPAVCAISIDIRKCINVLATNNVHFQISAHNRLSILEDHEALSIANMTYPVSSWQRFNDVRLWRSRRDADNGFRRPARKNHLKATMESMCLCDC